jgi:hypothetical protein
MSNSLVFPATTPNHSNPNHPARDEYHGVVVMDQYRWLEDGDDPAVKAWTHAQNRRTRDHLDAIDDREGVLAQLTSLFAQVTSSYIHLHLRNPLGPLNQNHQLNSTVNPPDSAKSRPPRKETLRPSSRGESRIGTELQHV